MLVIHIVQLEQQLLHKQERQVEHIQLQQESLINAATGAINLATSTPGTYTITYSFTNGACSNTATTSITITALPTATIAYSGSPYCATGTATVTQTGTAGGTYTAPAGVLSMLQQEQSILQQVLQVLIQLLTVSQVELAVILQQPLLQLLHFQLLQYHMPVHLIVQQEQQQLHRQEQQVEHILHLQE